MENTLKIVGIAFLVLLGIGLGVFLAINAAKVQGAAPGGTATIVTVATTTAVGPQEVIILFTDKGNCTSRIITTATRPINLSFGIPTDLGGLGSTTVVSATVGHYQAATTTVAYDSGIYGCGRVKVFGIDASTTITTSEFSGFR